MLFNEKLYILVNIAKIKLNLEIAEALLGFLFLFFNTSFYNNQNIMSI